MNITVRLFQAFRYSPSLFFYLIFTPLLSQSLVYPLPVPHELLFSWFGFTKVYPIGRATRSLLRGDITES